MRDYIKLYINGELHQIKGSQAFATVANYLRYDKGLTGTKIVCAEGDCGACSVLVSRNIAGKMTPFKTINSCISFLYLLDGCHLITVEGLGNIDHLHPAQKAMVESHGSQCGYCTPGFICSLASLCEDAKNKKFPIDERKVKNYLTGNLCRCTGYEPIIEAGLNIDLSEVVSFKKQFDQKRIEKDLTINESVLIGDGNKEVFLPLTLEEGLDYKSHHKDAKLTSGATDLGVFVNKGKIELTRILSFNNVSEFYCINDEKDELKIGAKVSLSEVEEKAEKSFPEFSRLIHIFASPQIKNKGTLVGNVINASPISDTIPFLMVAKAKLAIRNKTGQRSVDINDFLKEGYKQLDLETGEVVTHICIPKKDIQYKLHKVSVRKDLDISILTLAIAYKLEGGKFTDFSLSMGGVGPKVLRLFEIEKMMLGKTLDQNLAKSVSLKIEKYITPIDDLRASKQYRLLLAKNTFLKFCDEVMQEEGLHYVEASL